VSSPQREPSSRATPKPPHAWCVRSMAAACIKDLLAHGRPKARPVRLFHRQGHPYPTRKATAAAPRGTSSGHQPVPAHIPHAPSSRAAANSPPPGPPLIFSPAQLRVGMWRWRRKPIVRQGLLPGPAPGQALENLRRPQAGRRGAPWRGKEEAGKAARRWQAGINRLARFRKSSRRSPGFRRPAANSR